MSVADACQSLLADCLHDEHADVAATVESYINQQPARCASQQHGLGVSHRQRTALSATPACVRPSSRLSIERCAAHTRAGAWHNFDFGLLNCVIAVDVRNCGAAE